MLEWTIRRAWRARVALATVGSNPTLSAIWKAAVSSSTKIKQLAKANPIDVLNALNEAKKKPKAYDGSLGINNIDSWIRQVIKKTPLVIEYK